jgi:hypothetical protein
MVDRIVDSPLGDASLGKGRAAWYPWTCKPSDMRPWLIVLSVGQALVLGTMSMAREWANRMLSKDHASIIASWRSISDVTSLLSVSVCTMKRFGTVHLQWCTMFQNISGLTTERTCGRQHDR